MSMKASTVDDCIGCRHEPMSPLDLELVGSREDGFKKLPCEAQAWSRTLKDGTKQMRVRCCPGFCLRSDVKVTIATSSDFGVRNLQVALDRKTRLLEEQSAAISDFIRKIRHTLYDPKEESGR
jgi:hypothetical protein